MKFIRYVTLAIFLSQTTTIFAGIETIELDSYTLDVIPTKDTNEETEDQIRLCGERADNQKRMCQIITGLAYAPSLDSQVWQYESVVLQNGLLLTRSSEQILGELNEVTFELDLGINCKAELKEYRYNLQERLTAYIITGMWPKNSDYLSLYCEI